MLQQQNKPKASNMKKFSNLFEKSKSDPCWKGYEMVGMKDKNGKKVPNCVPVKESLEEQIQMLDEMPGANMDTRAVHQHLKKQGWKLSRSSGSHDVFTHPEAKHHIPVPRHRQLKAPLVKGILKQSQVREDIEQLEEGLQQTLRKFVPGYAKKQINDKMDAGKFGKTDADKDANFHRYKKVMRKITTKEEVEQLEEGRPSQRHPLEGHEYHRKTDAELEYIAKDAHKAAEAMKSHNTDAENKYRDQASDSATVRYYRKKNGMQPWYKKKYGHVNEDNVINTNSQNSLDGVEPATKNATTKKKQVIDRYTTGASSMPSATNVVASPRESVEIQEGYMKDKATDADFHPTVTKSKPPFDGPYKTKPKNVTDKSGAVHTPMSRVKNLAKQAARKNGGLKEENNDNTLSSYDKDDTPAKKTLSKTAGMVKDLANKAKVKAKGKKSDDTFQPEPELASNIVR
jgi:predicted RNA binding protein YcfA (HicA-like mRNA interferase family)